MVALALLAALIAAGLGSLPVALVLAAVALPSAVLVYIHDHRLWHDEPLTIIAVAFGLSLLLGIGVGLLETHFIKLVATNSTGYHLPPVGRILELGVLVPVAIFVAVMIAPLVVSARPAFRTIQKMRLEIGVFAGREVFSPIGSQKLPRLLARHSPSTSC